MCGPCIGSVAGRSFKKDVHSTPGDRDRTVWALGYHASTQVSVTFTIVAVVMVMMIVGFAEAVLSEMISVFRVASYIYTCISCIPERPSIINWHVFVYNIHDLYLYIIYTRLVSCVS